MAIIRIEIKKLKFETGLPDKIAVKIRDLVLAMLEEGIGNEPR